MTSAELEDFFVRAKLGLENADRMLLGAHLARGEHGGLVRLINERYYQFLVWQAVVPAWKAKVEAESHDLAVFDDYGNYALLCEMKCWMSAEGMRELPGIQNDLHKLARRDSLVRSMMIFSANPRGHFEEQADWISTKIPELSQARRLIGAFDTKNEEGVDFEFWLGLWVL